MNSFPSVCFSEFLNNFSILPKIVVGGTYLNEMKIAITGSYRSDEVEKYRFTGDKNDFINKCKLVGKCLAKNNVSLVAGWSNDYLSMQMGIDNDGHIKYVFEDSAEYHAMNEYMVNNGPNIILYMSKRLCSLFELYLIIKDKYKNNVDVLSKLSNELYSVGNRCQKGVSVQLDDKDIENKINSLIQNKHLECGENALEQTYLGYLLQQPNEMFIETIMRKSDKIDKRDLPDCELRTRILRNYVVKNSDALIAIGGGKATEFAINGALATSKFIFPFPEFGGEAFRYLCNLKLKRDIEGKRNVTPEVLANWDQTEFKEYCKIYSWNYKKISTDFIIEDTDSFHAYVGEFFNNAMIPKGGEEVTIKESISVSIGITSQTMLFPGQKAEAAYNIEIPINLIPEELKEAAQEYIGKPTEYLHFPKNLQNILTKLIIQNRDKHKNSKNN